MVVVKILNCIHQGRNNQNTTFVLFSRHVENRPIELITEEWVLTNLNKLKPAGVELQKNTSIKILSKR